MKIFGIGFPRTGTKTLGLCFQALGYNHQSRRLDLVEGLIEGDFEETRAVAENKDSFEDWPWIAIYKSLDLMFPGSKFVLTKRDCARWLRSYKNLRAGLPPSDEMDRVRRFLYGLPFPDVSDYQLSQRFEEHNLEVVEYFRERTGDLLILDWERGDGWKELCEFLGCPTPNVDLPHANRGDYSSQTRRRIRHLIATPARLLRRIRQLHHPR